MWYIYNVMCEIHLTERSEIMKNWYGCIGFLSLLGFWGILGDEPLFLYFFAFALFFEYFWVNPDEMFLENMRKCATLAFASNLLITTLATLILSYFNLSNNSLAAGTALGFGVSIAVFSFSTFVVEIRERFNSRND